MIKALVFISAILVFTYSACEGLECYHCFTPPKSGMYDQFPKCNEQNLTASNTKVCESPKSQCIYEELKTDFTNQLFIWRTCSDPNFKPCDPQSAPPGHKMVECSFCGTDRCNLHPNKIKENTFTININANVSLSIA